MRTEHFHTLSSRSGFPNLTHIRLVSDDNYFKHPSRAASQLAENWVLRLASLKRLFRLITQYFVDALNQPSSSLDVPDLQAIARDHDALHTMAVCRLVLAIAVQSEGKQEVVEHIKKLSERHQSALMRSIEEVCLSIYSAFQMSNSCVLSNTIGSQKVPTSTQT